MHMQDSLKTSLGTATLCLVLSVASCGTPQQPTAPNNSKKSAGTNSDDCGTTTDKTSTPTKASSGKSTTAKTSSSSTGSSGKTQLKLVDAVVGYKDTVKAIIDKNCISCHGAKGNPPNLSTYAAASAAADDSLKAVQGGTMPPNKKLATADTLKFSDWIEAGTPEGSSIAGGAASTNGKTTSQSNSDSPTCEPSDQKTTKKTVTSSKDQITEAPIAPATPSPGTLALSVTYDDAIASYLSTNCTSCHGNRSPKLETYAAAKANATAMLRAMKLTGSGKMPPSSGATAAAIEKVESWIKAGTPEK